MWQTYLIIALISVSIGSFLNVIIYRLPIMLEQSWRQESAGSLTLSLPASHCPHCQQTLRWYHNIPLISFCWLRGRCAFCQQAIAKSYFMVELLSLLVTLLLFRHYGLTWQFVMSALFSWLLIALIFIDLRHQLLPDILTLTLLWLGLLASTQSIFVNAPSAILGAVAGYSSLWTIAMLYQLISKREGMGHGDMKLLAALGAWTGWQHVYWIVFLGAWSGSICGIIFLMLNRKLTRTTPIAFGPYLAISGWCVLLWGDTFSQWLSHFLFNF